MKNTNEPPISRREAEVLSHIARGHSSKQIAGILGISVYTVNNHRCDILKKTQSKSMAEVVARYISFLT